MTVTNTVTRDTVDLRVSKTVTGAVDGYTGTGTDFTVGYTCYLADPAEGISDNVDIAAGAPSVVLAADIPAGWTCHVVEQPPSQGLLRDRSYAWGTPTHRRPGRRRERDGHRRPDARGDEPGRTPHRQLQRGQAARTHDSGRLGRRRRTVLRDLHLHATQVTWSEQGTWSIAGTGTATLCPGRRRSARLHRVLGDGEPAGRLGTRRRLLDLGHAGGLRPGHGGGATRLPRSRSPTPRAASTRRSRSARSTRDPPPPSCPAPSSPAPGPVTTRRPGRRRALAAAGSRRQCRHRAGRRHDPR